MENALESDPPSTTEVEKEFSYYGKLQSVWIARRPPGFAYVEFEDSRDARDAVKDLDGRLVLNKNPFWLVFERYFTLFLELASADESKWRFRMVASANRAGMFLFGGSPYLASPPTTTPSSRDRVSTTLLHYSYYYSTEYYTDYCTRVLLLYIYRNLQ